MGLVVEDWDIEDFEILSEMSFCEEINGFK